MSFYFNGLQYVPGGDPGDILFIDPTQPGVVDTDTFFKYDPTTRRVLIWGGIGAGLDIGTGGMRIAYDGIAGLSVGTVGGTNYLQIGTAAPGDLDIRARFLNLGVSGASTNALLDITGTWNTTGAANGIRLNVTDTASAAGALLMDLRVGGVSRFKTDKNGSIRFGQFNVGFEVYATGFILTAGGNFPMFIGPSFDVHLPGAGTLGWTSVANNPYGVGDDLVILRDAADTLAQRRGVNAQAFRVYNTFTDASNYERLLVRWLSNTASIFTESAGSGSARKLQVGTLGNQPLTLVSNGSERWAVDVGGHFLASVDNLYDIGAVATNRPRNFFLLGYTQMYEMTAPAAPAANSVRIYAEDNGAGKTRLMALFATGAAQQIAIEP